LSHLSIRETRELLRRGEFSVVEHVRSVLDNIAELDPDLGAFLSVADHQAVRDAEAADLLVRAEGSDAWRNRPLLGITVSVKDLIQTRGLPTTRGSLAPNRRADVDAPAVARLRAAGAIVVGKTTTSEYGWSASTVSRVAAPTRNPWDRDRSAGGSSGGAAAAVATGLCEASLGTDGAGSIRIPAAFCGVVGFKPSFGLVPYTPPGADRLSHLGPLARSVPEVAEIARVIAGPDPADPDSGPYPGADPYPAGVLEPDGVLGPDGVLEPDFSPAPLRIAWLEFGPTPQVRRVIDRIPPLLDTLGHHVDRIDLPFHDPYPAVVDILATAEAAGTRPADEDRSDPARLAVVRHGRTVTGPALMRAEQVRMDLRVRLRALMQQYDLLAMPTVPIEPFGVDAIAPPWACDPEDLCWLAWSPASYPFNLTGQPAVTLPVGLTRAGLPVGLQLVGPVGGDGPLLTAAAHIEARLDPFPTPPAPAIAQPVTKG